MTIESKTTMYPNHKRKEKITIATKQNNLSIKTIGLSVSAVLAVIYALVMFASLLLVSLGTTGSWQAALLGIGWSTVAGFEIGLLGIVIVSFALAAVFVSAYNVLRRQSTRQPDQFVRRIRQSRLIWVLIACLVLPPLALLALRVLAPFIASGNPRSASAAYPLDQSGKAQAVNLSFSINSALREAEPSFTADGRTMYFNCDNADICVSHLSGTWEAGTWTPPQRLGAPISTEYEEVEPLISPAGDKLYFNSNRPRSILNGVPFLSPFMNVFEVANIIASKSGSSLFDGLGEGQEWVSYRTSNGSWSEPRLLKDVPGEPPVYSAFRDHCLSFSADGNEAFWTSTRPGGFGGNDIWTSRYIDGQWTAPENLGPNVNSPGDEHHSIPTPDGRSLYVTTTRPGGFGGEDTYTTTRGADGKWRPLVNLGPLVNGPGNDRCPAWTPDFKIFLFDSDRKSGSGSKDIWWVYFNEVGSTNISTQAPTALSTHIPTPSPETAVQESALLLQTRCTQCHSLQKVQQVNKTRLEWEKTLSKMESFNVKLSDTEKTILLDYLTSTNKP